MKKADLMVGQDYAHGHDSRWYANLRRVTIVDLDSWVRVFDRERKETVTIRRSEYDRHPKDFGRNQWSSGAPQSGILVRFVDGTDTPVLAMSREIVRLWSEQEKLNAERNKAEEIRRAKVAKMKGWLADLGIEDVQDHWGYRLDQGYQLTYEQIEELHGRYLKLQRR